MKYMLLLVVLICQSGFSNDTLNRKIVESAALKFNIENGIISGEGAHHLIEEISKSQFILLGETHDDARIAEFTTALLDTLGIFGFKHFITEHGRFGLKYLLNAAKEDSLITHGLQRIFRSEFQRLSKLPVPFLSGYEDAEFLRAALDNNFHIFGIDQEYFYSYPFLFDVLFEKANETKKLDQRYQTAINYLLKEYELESQSKEHPFCQNLLDSESIKDFMALVSIDTMAQAMVNDIHQSWQIYALNRTNRKESFRQRGELMKTRFMSYYLDKISNKDQLPKFLIKLGALHTMRGQTPLGILDIGELIHKLAKKNETNDLNIYFMFRYYLDEEEDLGHFDNAEGNSCWLTERKPFMLQGEVDTWTLINLALIKEKIKNSKLFVYPAMQDIIRRHDYLIIPPASRDVRNILD